MTPQFSRPFPSILFCLLLLAVNIVHAEFESMDYVELRQQVEKIEKEDAYELEREALDGRIVEVQQALERFIEANPKHVDAMILSVRLGYIQELYIFSHSSSPVYSVDPRERHRDLHQRLDRVLALQPDAARAYYWKARLYGMNTPTIDQYGQLQQKPIDLDKAIQFASQALALDEENEWYREALAIYYVTAGDRKSALQVLEHRTTRFKPMTQLLRDQYEFPLPPDAVLLQKDTEAYAKQQLTQKTVKDYPLMRVQVYLIPGSAEEFAAFMQRRWPNFKFFNQGRADLHAQYMLLDAGGMRPSNNMAEARAWASKQLGGIILSVREISESGNPEHRTSPSGEALPESVGDKFCYLFYVNNRPVE